VQYTSNYNLKKPEGTDIVNIDDLNDNTDFLDQKLKEVENKADNAPPNSVNDAAIGSRTPDQSQAPASPGTGTLTQLISWLANRIKAITGKTNWWDAPPTTLQAAKTHMDAAAPHSGHETPSGAQAKADAALNSAKQYTDQEVGEVAQELAAHKAAAAPHSGHETPAGAQAKAEAAAGAVQAELDAHKEDNTPHCEAVTLYRKNKDENGIYTLLEWYRADETLFKTSELEGESPQYDTRRVKFYAEDGQTLVQEIVYTLTYDENGELISEVIQA